MLRRPPQSSATNFKRALCDATVLLSARCHLSGGVALIKSTKNKEVAFEVGWWLFRAMPRRSQPGRGVCLAVYGAVVNHRVPAAVKFESHVRRSPPSSPHRSSCVALPTTMRVTLVSSSF